MGYLVLAMFVAVLLAIFGKMKFHLKEISLNEHRLFGLITIRAANNSEMDSDVKSYLLSSSSEVKHTDEPVISPSSEIVSKISDAVVSRIEGLIKGKSS